MTCDKVETMTSDNVSQLTSNSSLTTVDSVNVT